MSLTLTKNYKNHPHYKDHTLHRMGLMICYLQTEENHCLKCKMSWLMYLSKITGPITGVL